LPYLISNALYLAASSQVSGFFVLSFILATNFNFSSGGGPAGGCPPVDAVGAGSYGVGSSFLPLLDFKSTFF